MQESENLGGSGARHKASIIVVNLNGQPLLEECLGALSQQTYTDYDIILVDNGSTDSSVSFVKEKFPAVKVVCLPINKGFTGGNIVGLGLSVGDFIALINNDTHAEERWLENLIQPMIEDSSIGICASKLLMDGTGKINSAGDGVTTAGVGFNRGLWRDASYYNSLELVFSGCGAAILYRRKMLETIGFLDENFFLYDEDTDLNFRAQLAGWKCMYVPSAVVYHKANATAGRLTDLHVYYHTRNLEFVWIKNMPTRLMIRFAHHKVIQEIGSFCYLCLRHWKWRPFFRAKRDALSMLPVMLKKRQGIQKEQKVSNHYLREILTPIFSGEMIRQKIRQFIRG